jgi:hypothetical protein
MVGVVARLGREEDGQKFTIVSMSERRAACTDHAINMQLITK